MKHTPIRKCPFIVLVLTKSYCAIVDRGNWPRIRKYHWHVHISKGKKRTAGEPYARATINGKKVYLHRWLTNCPPGFHVDHKNHQTLDCRVTNLEVVDHLENQRRRRNCKRKEKCQL